jgi:hypothetical protein
MTEDELRALVRESVERHLRRGPTMTAAPGGPSGATHVSHLILPVEAGDAIGDGICLIEPSVRCNHCGYCQSFGH